MIDKRIMYAQGRRVGFEPGGMAGEHGMGAGVGADGTTGGSGDGGGNTNREKGIMSQFTGPKGTTGNINDFTGDGGVDRSAVGQFSTYGKNKFNQNLRGPGLFSTIGTGIGNIGTGIKDYVLGGGMIGMGLRGLGNLFGGPPTDPMSFGQNNIPGYNQLNIAGPVVGPPAQREGEGEGIMNLYQPNMLNVAGEVVDEVPVSQEEEDFIQRFRGFNRTRQDKQGQLDPAILEMISKLYT